MKKKITATHIRLNKGGYDSSGRYWGTGQKLYLIDDPNWEGSTNSYYRDCYRRANSAKEAKEDYLANIAKSPWNRNPRTHFPKTRRGRPKEMKKWHILRKGKPPIRFNATKKDAHNRAQIYALRHGHIVLDGPK